MKSKEIHGCGKQLSSFLLNPQNIFLINQFVILSVKWENLSYDFTKA